MVLIGSIDPGLVNLGLSVVDSESGDIVVLKKISLLQPDSLSGGRYRYSRALLPTICKKFVEDHREILSSCQMILIEGQMQSRFIQMSLILEALCLEFCPSLIQHPSSVKSHFQTGTGNYKKNKEMAVLCCRTILSPSNWAKIERFPASKRDDCADAVLQAYFGLDNYDKLLTKYSQSPPLDKGQTRTRSKTKKRPRSQKRVASNHRTLKVVRL